MDDDKVIHFPSNYEGDRATALELRDVILELVEEVTELSRSINSLLRHLKKEKKL